MTYVRRHPPPNKPVCGKMPAPRRGMRRPVCADAHSCRPRLYFGSALFSLNSKVTATGMQVKTHVSDNLLIAETTLTNTGAVSDATFKTSYVGSIDTTLQPVSTVDGKNFFYTQKTNVLGSGNHINPTFLAYNDYANSKEEPTSTADLTDFRTNAGYTATDEVYGFKDFVFVLKAQNTATSGTAALGITKMNLVYGGDEKASSDDLIEQAFRVAVLVEDKGTTNGSYSGQSGTLKTILQNSTDTAGAKYFTDKNAVSSVSGLAAVNNLSTAAKIADVPANGTYYYKVVVRLWLEGEDESCNNETFAKLNDKWALDLEIQLAPSDTIVTAFSETDTATKITLSTTTNKAATTATMIDGVNYYKLDGVDYYTLSATFAANSRVFQLVDGHPIEVTNKCSIS